MGVEKDLYKILGIKKNASDAAIKKAFRKRSLETHPDRGGDEKEFIEVQFAHRILSDKVKRKLYDTTGQADAFAPDNSHVECLQLLSQTFLTLLRHLINNNVDPTKHDMIGSIRATLEKSKKEFTDTMSKMTEVEKTLGKVRGRFKTKKHDKDNYFESVVQAELAQLLAARTDAQRKAGLHDQALEILSHFTYDKDIDEQIKGMHAFGSWTVFTQE